MGAGFLDGATLVGLLEMIGGAVTIALTIMGILATVGAFAMARAAFCWVQCCRKRELW